MAKATGDGGALSASQILTKVAQPNYWDSVLNLGTPPELEGAGPGGNVAGKVYTQPGSNAPSAGGTGGTATEPAVPDWEQALINQGLPPELVAQIKAYYGAHADDPDVQTKTLALVRGSDWWKAAYAGFWEGYKNGLFTDESGYRSWLVNANDAWNRYYGRPLTPDERVSYLAQGFAPARLEQLGAGHAYAQVNKPDIQWETGAFSSAPLTDAEREAYGQEATGLDSAFGQQIKARVDKAIQTAQAVFGGTLATPNLSVGGAGLSAPSLNPQPKPDISA